MPSANRAIYATEKPRAEAIRSPGKGQIRKLQSEKRGQRQHLECYSADHLIKLWTYLDAPVGSGLRYRPPANMIGIVGVALPASDSIVIANPLASKSFGKDGMSTVALPRTSGLNTPTGIGAAPLVGKSQS